VHRAGRAAERARHHRAGRRDAATGPCAGNTISGPANLADNQGGVEFNDNVVNGPLTISGTTGALSPPDTGSVHAVGNTVTGPSRISP
jgi:hypothetical protein